MPENWREAGFGVYLHWPFCESKCPYCDFNSHVAGKIDHKDWEKAFLGQIAAGAAETPGRIVNSVYFGGGTPGLMPAGMVSAIIDKIAGRWKLAADAEITLEANPGSVEMERLKAFRQAGVNRVSIGAQALSDADLKALGRLHDARAARKAIGHAKSVFDRVSFDLIYGRQSQTAGDWEKELKGAMDMAGGHVSLYQLTIEPGTAFGNLHRKGRLKGLPDEGLEIELWGITRDVCASRGYSGYEISNFATTGQESRHNLIYWRCGDYLGIGPGAHGRLTANGARHATESHRDPGEWLARTLGGESGESCRSRLSPEEQGLEYILNAARLLEGISVSRWERHLGRKVSRKPIAELESMGIIEARGDRLAFTDSGRLALNRGVETLAESQFQPQGHAGPS